MGKIFLTYLTIMYLFEPALSKHVHLCPLLIANHKLKFHFEMILEKENGIYLSDLLSLIFFSLSSRMASSYELNVHLMAEVKYHTHTYLKIVVSTSLEIH